MSTVTQLELGPEFKQPTTGLRYQIGEMLTGASPVFLNSVAMYEEIIAEATAAKAELDKLVDQSDPESVRNDEKLMRSDVTSLRKAPDQTRYQEYCHRDHLRGAMSMISDTASLIRGESSPIVAKLKTTLPLGPNWLGQRAYFLELDPRQLRFPGRVNLYKLADEVEYPVAFGDDIKLNPIEEPFIRAQVLDLVLLVRDLQATANPSQ